METATFLFRNSNLGIIGRPNNGTGVSDLVPKRNLEFSNVGDPVPEPNMEFSSMEPRGISLVWAWEAPQNTVPLYSHTSNSEVG